MLEISIRHDLDRFAKQLDEMAKRQVRFAAANALNDVGNKALADLKQAMPEIFDRPKPYTVNAFRRVPAHRDDLKTTIAIKDVASGGKVPQSQYLAPEILGGGRGIKRFEAALDAIAGTSGREIIPARDALGEADNDLLDRFGNIPSGTIRALLSDLPAFTPSAKPVAKPRRRGKGALALIRNRQVRAWLVRSKQSRQPLGIWRLLAPGKVAPVLLFAQRAPSYRARFDFTGFVSKAYQSTFMVALKTRFAEALATAKPGKGMKL